MRIDRREDAGDFYPGGKVISTRPVATGGDVKHSDFAGLDVKTNTIPDLRDAVRELGRRLGATVVTALAACVATAATVQTVPVNGLDFDANPSIVTNVVFDAPPDFSTNNTALVETIHQTEVDPTVPAWAKKTVGDFYSDNLYSLVNRDFYAKNSSINSQASIWLKGSSNPTVNVGRDKLSDNTFPYSRQTVLGFSAYEGFDYYAHYRPRGIYIWPWWNEDAEDDIAYLFPTNGNGGTFALTSDIAGKQDNLPYPTNAIPYAAITGKPSLATVATSGSYNDLSNKPQINGVSLSGSKTGADLGVLDLAGGNMTGYLITPFVASAKVLNSEDVSVGPIWYNGAAVLGKTCIWLENVWPDPNRVVLWFPKKTGTLALVTDIDAAISPTSPAFSNAVLSVGLGIDTNTVAAINELVDSSQGLPVSGMTSVGALILALAAAVAALKKKFGYDTEDSAASAAIALSTRTFPVVDATAKTSADTIAVTMPSSTADGKVSDMCLRIDTGASVPALTFDLSANVFIPASGDDAWGTLEASSHNVFSFTSSGTQTVAVTDAANGNAVTNVTKRVWIVGRVTAAIVAAETINESAAKTALGVDDETAEAILAEAETGGV